jgi:hypothetical protein
VLERINLYDGGVVTLAKNLSDQGKTIKEILEEIQIQFPNLPAGRKGKPTEKTGLQNLLKKALGLDLYKERHSPKRITKETIEEFKRIRPFTSETDIKTQLGISKPYQTKLARALGLPSKTGEQVRSKIFEEAESVGTAIKNRIDLRKSVKENLDVIYPDVKDQTFRTSTNAFGKPTKRAVQTAINRVLMDANQLSVDEYKEEIKKMVADRNYSPKGLDPLGIKTEKLTYYKIPNYEQAKKELAPEIPSLDKRLQTNLRKRKTTKRKLKEIENPLLKLSRLGQRARNRQKRRLQKLGLSSKLSSREEAINQTQTTIQKAANDKIKANPEGMLKYLKANPNILRALGTRVNRQTGQIYYENPNLSFLNTDPKDSARYFELDHGRELSKQAGKLSDVPENRNTIPRLLNQGFKRDAEIYIESNPNPQDPNVRAVLEEAKKLQVRIRPKVPPGLFKADDFFKPTPHPLIKIQDAITLYAPEEFHTREIVLPKDRTGKVITQLSATSQKAIKTFLIKKATNNEDNVCEVVFGVQGQATGGTVGGGCAKQMELEFDKAPEQTLNKISQSNSPKLKTFAQRALSLLPKLGTPGKIAAGVAAGVGTIGALTYNKELGEFVNPLNDDKASQGTLTEWIKENPVKTVAGTSIGFSAQEIPGAYKKARELGRGRTRSALGITGALKPVLTTFGTPAMTALFEVPFGAKRLEEGETMTEVLTDPLGPALGLTFMEPLSRGAGVIRGGAASGIMGGIKRAFNPFDLSNVGSARPGLTSKILRMGLSPRVIAGISRLGPYGMLAGAGLAAFDQYQKYQNEEGMLYNLLNE